MSVVSLVDSKLDLNSTLNKGTRLGYESVNVVAHDPTNGNNAYGGGSNMAFNIPMSTANLLDSAPVLSCQIHVTYTNGGTAYDTGANGVTGINNQCGLHSFPVNRLFENINVRINGSLNMSTNVAANVDSVQYMLSKQELKRLSNVGVPDNAMVYSTDNNTSVLRTQMDSRDFSRGIGATRVEAKAVAGQAAQIAVTYFVSEKLLARPFQWAEQSPKVFKGINDLVISGNLTSNLQNAVLAAIPGVNVVAGSFKVDNFKLRLKQSTPHANLKKPVSNIAYYNAPVFDYMSAVASTAATGQPGSAETNPRVFSSVPKMYAIYFAAPRTLNQPLQMFPITNVSINCGIKSNLLQSYTAEDLYDVSIKNGYNGNPSQFFGGNAGSLGTGCVLYLTNADFDTDMFSQSNVLKNLNFQVKATYKNHTGANVTPTLHVVAISDAYIKSENGVYTEQLASILPSEVASARDMYEDMGFEDNKVLGGSVWGWMKKHIIKPAVKFARNNVGKLHTGIGPLDAVAKDVGKLVDDNSYIGRQAAKHGLGQRGAGVMQLGGASTVLGGKKLSQAQMLALLDM